MVFYRDKRDLGGRLIRRFGCWGFEWFEKRERKNVANGRGLGGQHHNTVDADAEADGWRKAAAQRVDVLVVRLLCFRVAGKTITCLPEEATVLFARVCELLVTIGNLTAANEELKAVCEIGAVGHGLGERTENGGELSEKSWRHKERLKQRGRDGIETLGKGELARAQVWARQPVFKVVENELFVGNGLVGGAVVAKRLEEVIVAGEDALKRGRVGEAVVDGLEEGKGAKGRVDMDGGEARSRA